MNDAIFLIRVFCSLMSTIACPFACYYALAGNWKRFAAFCVLIWLFDSGSKKLE